MASASGACLGKHHQHWRSRWAAGSPRIRYSLQQFDYLCKPGAAWVALRTSANSGHLWAARDSISSALTVKIILQDHTYRCMCISIHIYIYIHRRQAQLGFMFTLATTNSRSGLFKFKNKKLKLPKFHFITISNYFRSRNQGGFFTGLSAAAVNTVISTCLEFLFMEYETEQKQWYVSISYLALQG